MFSFFILGGKFQAPFLALSSFLDSRIRLFEAALPRG